jgi:hypothetical protein
MSLFTMGKRVKEAQSSEEPKSKVAKLAKDAQESKKKGRTLGAKNYNRELLLSIINTWKPSSSVVWETVTEQYHKKSEEDKLRDPQEVKKYFITKMCNNGIKPKLVNQHLRNLSVIVNQSMQKFLILKVLQIMVTMMKMIKIAMKLKMSLYVMTMKMFKLMMI